MSLFQMPDYKVWHDFLTLARTYFMNMNLLPFSGAGGGSVINLIKFHNYVICLKDIFFIEKPGK